MGMFDRVWFKCPSCGEDVEVQSKAGNCFLSDFDQGSVPLEIAKDIGGEPAYCRKCQNHFHVVCDDTQYDTRKMRLK